MITLRLYQDGDENLVGDCIERISGPLGLSYIKDSSVLLTAVDDGIPVGCGGVVFLAGNDGEIWLRLSPSFLKRKTDMVRILRKGIEIIREFGLDNIYAKVKEGFIEGELLVKKFGFTETGETKDIAGVIYKVYHDRC
jgi:hypothetical protein